MLKPEETWHPYKTLCDKCDGNTTTAELCFNASGDILIMGYCPKCGVLIEFKTTWTKVCSECYRSDKEDALIILPDNGLIN